MTRAIRFPLFSFLVTRSNYARGGNFAGQTNYHPRPLRILYIGNLQSPSVASRLGIRGAAHQIKQVQEKDGSEMTGQQVGTVDGECKVV
jgi:hypothetical protein